MAFQQLPRAVPGQIEAEDFDPAGYSDTTSENEDRAYRTDTGLILNRFPVVTPLLNGQR